MIVYDEVRNVVDTRVNYFHLRRGLTIYLIFFIKNSMTRPQRITNKAVFKFLFKIFLNFFLSKFERRNPVTQIINEQVNSWGRFIKDVFVKNFNSPNNVALKKHLFSIFKLIN